MASKLKKKRNQEDTKAKLLKAALDVFSRSGYDAATTRNIAKKAAVNESLIHRYFKSKLGLFVALKHQFKENLVLQFLAYEESETLEEELTKFIRSRLESTRRDKKFFKLAISRSILDPKMKEEMRNYTNIKPPALLERFERFRRKGLIRADVDLDQVISVLSLISFALSMLADAIECSAHEEAERLVKAAADILSGGLSPRGPAMPGDSRNK